MLFESGIAATNLNWFHIQEQVSRIATTASYDRGGLGWSSPCRTARTPGNIAAELHRVARWSRDQAPLRSGGTLFRRPGDAEVCAAVPGRSDQHRTGRSDALRRMAAAGPDKTGDARPRPETLGLCDSDCTIGIGSACGDLAVVPLRARRRAIGSALPAKGASMCWGGSRAR